MKLAAVVVVALVGGQAHAQAPGMTEPLAQPAQPRGEPPIEASTVTGQIMLGGLFGVGGAAVGALAGIGISCQSHCDDDDIVPVLVVSYTSASLAIAAGEYLIGKDDTSEGSFGWTFGGAMLGGLIGIAGAVAVDNGFGYDHKDARDTLEILSIAGGWLGGGLVGYYETRHWKTPARTAIRPTFQADVRGMSFGVGGAF